MVEKYQIFISYSHKDSITRKAIQNELEKLKGIEVIFDERIRLGKEIYPEVRRLIPQ